MFEMLDTRHDRHSKVIDHRESVAYLRFFFIRVLRNVNIYDKS
jgi:hypothetical protein